MTTDRPSPFVRATQALEHNDDLEHLAERLHPVVSKLLANPTVRHALQGRAMGHALHPVLTDVPIGAWLSAAVLDVVGGEGSRDAARRLVGVGVLTAVPTAVAGWAEWVETEGANRRVGTAHAAANNVAVVLYLASWLARRAGHHRAGLLLGMKGMAVVGVGGFLGAHLSLARKVASRHEAFDDGVQAGPHGQEQPIEDTGELAAGGTA